MCPLLVWIIPRRGETSMFNKKQVENISKFFWEIAKVMVASGAVAGIMMTSVPIWKVLLACIFAGGFAMLGFLVDSTLIDDDTEKKPP
ncbi:hypothetical protein EG827_09845 [bacterium]|nr:hypothetical protein [bacterium]